MLIRKPELRTLIPHAGAMCLLDGVLAWNDEQISCLSETHHHQDNPLRRDGILLAVHAFEYAAQATAVHGGLRARSEGSIAAPGYFAGLRDAHLHASRLDNIAAPLTIRARRLFGDNADTVYQCEVTAAAEPIADARITIMLRPSVGEP